jgi:hypothetical protein
MVEKLSAKVEQKSGNYCLGIESSQMTSASA